MIVQNKLYVPTHTLLTLTHRCSNCLHVHVYITLLYLLESNSKTCLASREPIWWADLYCTCTLHRLIQIIIYLLKCQVVVKQTEAIEWECLNKLTVSLNKLMKLTMLMSA